MKTQDVDWVLFSVDPVIFTFYRGELSVLLVLRSFEPFEGHWGLPGGRVDQKVCTDLDAALALKLESKTGLKQLFFEQLGTYGSADMDPRGWSVTTAYLALVNERDVSVDGILGEDYIWAPVLSLESYKLAFWHERIIKEAYTRLRDKSLYTDLPVNFMPELFTYPMLKEAYEKILDIEISRQRFAKRMDSAEIFEDSGLKEKGRNRPSPLYRKKDRGGAYIFPGIIKGA
jgi:ADP-ribose pyrophosphatase YjhB (NUDIX family)